MRTNLRRGRRALVLVGLTWAVSLAGRAQAQQTGLFPLAPIRRQRVPCEQADPVYKIYKQQYFGYHPTCWRRFPDGWGCPSPEAPNREKSFQDIKPGAGAGAGPEAEAPPPEEMGAPPAGGARPTPTLPEERSPFETDTGAPGGAAMPGQPLGRPAPRATPPPEGRSPFETLNPQDQAQPPRRNPQAGPTAPPPGANPPQLSAPDGQPQGGASGYRSMRDESDEEVVGRVDETPLLDVPSIDLSRAETPGPFFDPPSSTATTSAASTAATPAATETPPPSAPPRRGLLSNLFGGLGLNWFRR